MKPAALEKLLFIVNPRSGVLKKQNVPALIEQYIDRKKFEVEIQFTAYAGHARELAAQAVKANFDAVIAVGGDGSINEIGSSLVGTSVALGILPMGSGNGLARHLGIPLVIPQAIQRINQFNCKTIDTAKANEHYFFSMCGIGFDGFIANQFQLQKKRGIFTYLKLSAYHYFRYKPSTYTICIDGQTRNEKAFIIAIANSNQFGSNFKIAPHADLQDGLLHCCIVKPITLLKGLPLVWKGFNGQLKTNSSIAIIDCKTVVLDANGDQYFHLDGEPMKPQESIRIEVVPHSLKVVA